MPTEAGRSLYEDAKAILELVEKAKQNARKARCAIGGHVSVGIIPSACLAFGQQILDELADKLPDVTINLVEGFSAHIENWLVSGEIDLAVFYPSVTTSVYEVQPLMEQSLVLAGAYHDKDLPAEISDFSMLQDFPLVSSTRRNKVRKLLDTAAANHNVTLSITAELDSLPAIKDLVIRGNLYAILEPLAVYREVQARLIKTCRLADLDLSRTLYLGWATSRPLDRGVREVAGRLEQIIPRGCLDNPALAGVEGINTPPAQAI